MIFSYLWIVNFCFFIFLIIYLFLALLGLCCCLGFSIVVTGRGYSLVAVCRFLTLSLSFFFGGRGGGLSCCKKWAVGCVGFTACGFWTLEHWFNSCGIQALLLDGMWDLPGSGIKPISPAIAGGFFALSQHGGLYQEKS